MQPSTIFYSVGTYRKECVENPVLPGQLSAIREMVGMGHRHEAVCRSVRSDRKSSSDACGCERNHRHFSTAMWSIYKLGIHINPYQRKKVNTVKLPIKRTLIILPACFLSCVCRVL